MIIFPFIFILLIMLIWVANSWGKRKGAGFLRDRFISIFLIVLIVSTVMHFFLPERQLVGEKIDISTIPDIFHEGYEGRIDQVDSQYLLKEWTFTPKQEMIQIALPDELNQSQPQIFVERIKGLDVMEVGYYRTPVVLTSGLDISGYLSEPRLRFEAGSNQIIIEDTGYTVLELVALKREFPINQFYLDQHQDFFEGPLAERGDYLFYLRIPEQADVEAQGDIWIEWIGEETESE